VRIAYITETYPPELNGVALTVARTVDYLRERGHEVELIRPRQSGETRHADDAEWLTPGCPIPMYPDLRFGLARARSLVERFKRTRPRIVHVATQGPLGWAAVHAAHALSLPLSSDFRTNFHQYSRYYGLGWMSSLVHGYLRRFHNQTQRTFVPTQALRDELEQAHFEHLTVVGRGVDAQLFSPARRSAALRSQWQAGRAPVLLYVGRLAAEKNVNLALCAFEAARRRLPTAQMVVVGDGPQRTKLQLDYPDAHFVGVQRGEALAAHYASADVFLFPSLSETFGNVTLEALASGLPVVAFDSAAAAEYVDDCASGLLVKPGDELGFIAAACNMAWQHEQLSAMRDSARASALKARWDKVLARFELCLAETVYGFEASPTDAAVTA
jgi:glycosyltransferase involved in cell wall biosynthesis